MIARIRELAHEIWREYYPRILSSEQIEYMLAQMYSIESLQQQAAEGVIFELIDDVGFVAYGPDHDTTWKIHKLYLKASARGTGLGQRTLAHVESTCLSHGATHLILNVNKHNTTAIKAYERAGYTRLTSVTIDIGHGFVMDDHIYAKKLGTGTTFPSDNRT